MDYLVFCPNKPRLLKKSFTTILKKELVSMVKKINYTKSYYVDSKKNIKSKEEKMILLINCNNINLTKSIIEWTLWEEIYIIEKLNGKI